MPPSGAARRDGSSSEDSTSASEAPLGNGHTQHGLSVRLSCATLSRLQVRVARRRDREEPARRARLYQRGSQHRESGRHLPRLFICQSNIYNVNKKQNECIFLCK